MVSRVSKQTNTTDGDMQLVGSGIDEFRPTIKGRMEPRITIAGLMESVCVGWLTGCRGGPWAGTWPREGRGVNK